MSLYTDKLTISPTKTILRWEQPLDPNIRLYNGLNSIRKLQNDKNNTVVTSSSMFILGTNTNSWTYTLHENCTDLLVGVKNSTVNLSILINGIEKDKVLFELNVNSLKISHSRDNNRLIILSQTFDIANYTNETVKSFASSKFQFGLEINENQSAEIYIKDNKTVIDSTVPISFSGTLEVGIPITDNEIANKQYVDSFFTGSPGSGITINQGNISITTQGVLQSMIANNSIDVNQAITTGANALASKQYVDTLFSAGAGISVSNFIIEIPEQNITNSMVLDNSITASKVLTSGVDAIASKQYVDGLYTAGSGLSLNSTTKQFSIPTAGITNNMLAVGSVDSSKCATSSSVGICTLSFNQTLTGNKEFTGTVTVPNPTSNFHASTKKYVDDKYIPGLGLSESTNGQIKTFFIENQGVDTNQLANDAVTSAKVRTTGTSGIVTTGDIQDVYGVKTFKEDTIFEQDVTVINPTSDFHAATKKYVDDKYIPGLGLSESTNGQIKTFFIDNQGVDTNQLANDAVTSAKVRTTGTSGIVTTGDVQDIYGVKTFKEDTIFEKGITINHSYSAVFKAVSTSGEYNVSLGASGGLQTESYGLTFPGTAPPQSSFLQFTGGGANATSLGAWRSTSNFLTFNYNQNLPTSSPVNIQSLLVADDSGGSVWSAPSYRISQLSSKASNVSVGDRLYFNNSLLTSSSGTTVSENNGKFTLLANRLYMVDITFDLKFNTGPSFVKIVFTNSTNTSTVIRGAETYCYSNDVYNSTGASFVSSASIHTIIPVGNSNEQWWVQINQATGNPTADISSSSTIRIMSLH